MRNKILLLGLISPPLFIGLFLLVLKVGHEDSINSAPSRTFISACSAALTETLGDIKSSAENASKLGKQCYNGGAEECKKANIASSEVIEFLESKDLGLRWNHFSCSPLLFSKLRQMTQAAETLQLLSSLRRKTPELDKVSGSILEPLMFISEQEENIKRDCCEKRAQ